MMRRPIKKGARKLKEEKKEKVKSALEGSRRRLEKTIKGDLRPHLSSSFCVEISLVSCVLLLGL